jgi:hypothetical protein
MTVLDDFYRQFNEAFAKHDSELTAARSVPAPSTWPAEPDSRILAQVYADYGRGDGSPEQTEARRSLALTRTRLKTFDQGR